MTISLNGVILDPDLFWEDEFNYTPSAQTLSRTILGNLIIQTMPLNEGNEILLSSQRSGNTYTGHFTRAQLEGFKLLEKNQTEVEFIYGSESHQVIVKSGGIQVQPLIPYTTKTSTDKYTGIITLIKVS